MPEQTGMEAELIPWGHQQDRLMHKQAVDYIATIPKNSVLAMEVNAKFLSAVESQLYEARPELNSLIATAPELYEVVLACQKRNIRIAPIEPLTIRKSADLPGKSHEEKARIREKREASFVEKTVQILRGRRIKKVYVLTGADHTYFVMKGLRKQGVRVRVNTRIFGEKQKEVARHILLSRTRRALERQGKPFKELRSIRRPMEEVGPLPTFMSAVQRKENQAKRAQRRRA